MLVYGVPRDLPLHDLSFEAIVLGDLDYAIGAFNTYVDTNRDYSIWFVESSTGPIIGDVFVTGGRVLRGVICAQVAIGAEWRVRAETAEARVTELEALFATKEVHMQKETARALA